MDNAFIENGDIDQESLSSVSSADINQMNVSMETLREDNLEKKKSSSIDSCTEKSQLRDGITYDSMYKLHDFNISSSPIGIPQTFTKIVTFSNQRSTPFKFKESDKPILDLSGDKIQRKRNGKNEKGENVLIANLKNNMKSKGLADIAKDLKQKINIFKKSLEESETDIESLLSTVCHVRSIGTGTNNSVLNVSGKDDSIQSDMGNAHLESGEIWKPAFDRVLIELMNVLKANNEKSGMKNSILRSCTEIERVSKISIESSNTFLSRESISSKACNQSQDRNIECNDLHDSQNSNTFKSISINEYTSGNINSTAKQSCDDSLNHCDTVGTNDNESNSKSPTRNATFMISEVESDENAENKPTNDDTESVNQTKSVIWKKNSELNHELWKKMDSLIIPSSAENAYDGDNSQDILCSFGSTLCLNTEEKRWEAVKEKTFFNGALQVSQLKNYSANPTVRVSAANINNRQQKSSQIFSV